MNWRVFLRVVAVGVAKLALAYADHRGVTVISNRR
jgi:hypothetical protein